MFPNHCIHTLQIVSEEIRNIIYRLLPPVFSLLVLYNQTRYRVIWVSLFLSGYAQLFSFLINFGMPNIDLVIETWYFYDTFYLYDPF